MSMHQLGPLIRLWGLPITDLPPPGVASDDLAPFLIAVLQEAVPFLDTISPRRRCPADTALWKAKGAKSYPDSAAPVQVLERVIPVTELALVMARSQLAHSHEQANKLRPETWACRRSVHEDAARPGTATWAEFTAAIKTNHAEAEVDYMPNLRSLHTPLEWDCAGVEAHEGGALWRDFTLKVHESRHNIGAPLKNRVFAFLVVSIAIADFASAPEAVLSKDKGPVVGAYTSVERVRKLDSGEIEWIMATVSDAKGVLPLWVQAKAVPGQVARDNPELDSSPGDGAERPTDSAPAQGGEANPAQEAPPVPSKEDSSPADAEKGGDATTGGPPPAPAKT
ncbi:unnamed protein product [Parascedosporium putredinis]|uniref:DUF3074 domain-containing protein n=1 Tax=Parascedosporium putredinis TaxID=1442378 RepID=A0A9P1H4R9_9PEZI|nr:unnamed protein product [Parascedosporium putredinis]CAI7998552.1 unnamed protein product [Parascedosporium putredinis]